MVTPPEDMFKGSEDTICMVKVPLVPRSFHSKFQIWSHFTKTSCECPKAYDGTESDFNYERNYNHKCTDH